MAKLFPASIENDTLYIEKTRPRVYRKVSTTMYQPIAAGLFAPVPLLTNKRLRVWEIYLKTFFGDFPATPFLDGEMPDYDLIHAQFEYTKEKIWINGVEMRVIPGYFGYFISNNGVVYSILRNKIMKHRIDEDGYHKVDLFYREEGDYRSKNSHPDIRLIHHLVYMAWTGTIVTSENVIHHKDSIIFHNNIDNLELTTAQLNRMYSVEDGLQWGAPSTFNWTRELVDKICKMMTEGKTIHQMACNLGIDINKDPWSYTRLCNKVAQTRRYVREGGTNNVFHDVISKYNGLDEYQWAPGEITKGAKFKMRDNKGPVHTAKNVIDRITEEELQQMLFEFGMGVTGAELGRRHNMSACSARRLMAKYNGNSSSTTIERVSDQ